MASKKVQKAAPAAPVEPSAPAALTREELWGIERVTLLAQKADLQQALALAQKAIAIRKAEDAVKALETDFAAAQAAHEEQKKTHGELITSIKARLGIEGEFEFDPDTGFVTAGIPSAR